MTALLIASKPPVWHWNSTNNALGVPAPSQPTRLEDNNLSTTGQENEVLLFIEVKWANRECYTSSCNRWLWILNVAEREGRTMALNWIGKWGSHCLPHQLSVAMLPIIIQNTSASSTFCSTSVSYLSLVISMQLICCCIFHGHNWLFHHIGLTTFYHKKSSSQCYNCFHNII